MLPTRKETGFGVVTQGAFNWYVRSNKSTRKSSYEKYTSKRCFQIAKYASETTEIAVPWFKREYRLWIPEKIPRPDENCWEEEQICWKTDSQLATWKVTTSKQWHWWKSEKIYCDFTLHRKTGNFSIEITVAKALIEKDDHESLKVLKLRKDWAQSFFRRMGFKKRAATTGKVIIFEGWRKEAELIYLYDIVTKIESHNIPHQLFLTWTKLL